MSPRIRLLAAICLFLVAPTDANARAFGRNKVQYDTFDWKVLRTEHLEIHFYQGEEALARRAAKYGEDACRRLDAAFDQDLTRRIPVLIYGSHYHFRQNNVTPGLVGESTGGFTEIFRNRVVVPYSGSEEDFRHVIHHELVHAYVFDRFYGGKVKSLFVMQYAFYVPLWFMEGIAEYYSNEWDSEGEMMLRDASVHGGLPPFPRIHGGYFVYKAGASAVGFLVDRHGDDVIARILDELNRTRDIYIAVRNVTEESLDELGEDWLHGIRKRTWPTIAELEGIDEYGRILADGATGIDSHPVLSPDGTQAVFLSTRSGTPDLWVVGTEEGADAPKALARGARGGQFESLHPLHSSVGWSPDGENIVAAAQKGARDAIYVIDVKRGKSITEITPDLDALERPDWSPDGARFVFTGMRGGQVDLWTIEPDGSGLARLTNDLHEDRAPRWSPDGSRVLFTSDRGQGTGLDLYVVDVQTGAVTTLVARSGDQWDGCWANDGRAVYYATDEWGTRDLVRQDLASGERKRLTRLTGGVASPSVARNGGQLAFTVYEKGRFRAVFVAEPDSMPAVTAESVHVPREFWPASEVAVSSGAGDGDDGETEIAQAVDPEEAPSAEPELRDYDANFRPEWLAGNVGYGGFGFHLGFQTAFSDVLGDHRATLSANIFRSMENTDAFLSYTYLKRRIDWGVSAFHFRDFLWDDRTTLGQPIGEEGDNSRFSERQWGLGASASYPFHTFRRVDLGITAMTIDRERFDEIDGHYFDAGSTRTTVLLPRLSHSFDNTLWGSIGPMQGARSVAVIQYAHPVAGDRVEFGSATVDVRRYVRFSEQYVLAVRAMASSSFGPDPREYQLGGPNTIRGFRRQSIRGRNAALLSVEYRYPFLEYVKFGWPLRAAFGGVRGNMFIDVGTAFDDPGRARLTDVGSHGHKALDDLYVGFGVGTRMRIAFFPIRIDVAWPTDGATVGKPRWHFALGPEF